MKKIITLITLFACITAFSQKNVAKKVNELISQNATFKHISILTPSNIIADNNTRKVVEKASYAKINTDALTDIATHKYENLEIEVPYNNQIVVVQLYKVNPFAEGFHVDTDKSRSISYDKGLYYRGIVKNDGNSVVSFNFFKDELNAVISSASLNNLVVGKLNKANNVSDYIIYSDSDMKVINSYKCATKESAPKISANRNNAQVLSDRCVTMYFEVDNDLYQENNSSTTTTTNWMTSVFNNVQTLYTNDGITVSLKSIFIWTTSDPYDGIGESSSDYLYKFNDIRPVFDGDVGQLVGIDPGGLGGVAVSIDGLCSQDNFSYADVYFDYNTVPTYSWTIMVITHEFGHLLGSPHTHGCYWNGNDTAIDGCGSSAGYVEGNCEQGPIPSPSVKGTIMSYCHLVSGVGINLANGFGPQPAALILSSVNSGTCLSTDCVNTCINTIAAINVSNVTNTTASIAWTELGNSTSWEVSVNPFTNPSPVWTTVSAPTFSASGLTPNTFYRVAVRPICGGLTAPNEQTVFATPAAWCDGVTITDTGGNFEQYTDSETYVRTIIPNVPNKKIVLSFSEFDLEDDYDYLYVYDGNTTAAPDLSNGGFTGTDNPGQFTSTAADGSLTIRFTSDGGVTAQGYVASVDCLNTLGTNAYVPNIDFTYYPNPANGMVTVTSKTSISEISVYNVTGQLLYQNKINGTNAKVDVSAFATGTYFFKLKFDGKEANFKIQKM